MKKKNPFVTYTTDQILESESDCFVIQMGKDLFSTDTQLSFTKHGAEMYYDILLLAFKKQLKSGTKKEKREAKEALKNFRILPLRFH